MPHALYLLSALLLLAPAVLQAQDVAWIPVDGPDGGAIVRDLVAETDGALLAATEGGVYRLTEGEAQWTRDSEGLLIDNATAFWRTPEGAVLVGTFGVGVYRRPAGGLVWTPTPLNQIVTVGFAQRDTTLYAASPDAFFASGDDGRTWRRLPGLGLEGIAVSGIAANADFLFVGTDTGVFRTNDDGETWEFVIGPWGDFPNVTAVAVDSTNGTLYVGTSPLSDVGSVYRSRNNGGLWTRTPANPVFVGALYASQEQVYAGGFQFVYRSANEGISWRSARATVTTVLGFHVQRDTVWVATEGRGVLRSTDGGSTWATVNAGLQSSIHTLTADASGTLYAGTSGGVYASADEGGTWTLRDAGLTTFNVRDVAVGPDGLLYAATFGEVYLYSTADAEWKAIGPGEGLSMRDLAFGPDGTLYGGYFDGLYVRENRTWTPLPVVGPDGLTRDVSTVFVDGAGRIFAGGAYDAFRYDADRERWTQLLRDGLTPFTAQAFRAAGDTLWAATRFSGVLQTTDEGETWTPVGSTAPQDLRSLARDDAGWLYAAAFGNGIYRFHPATGEAEAFNEGLTDRRVTEVLFTADGRGYASTAGRGLFRLGTPSSTATTTDRLQPQARLRAYPNPGQQRVALDLGETPPGNVQYAIYTVLGQQVKQGQAHAHQSIVVDDLAPGLYIITTTQSIHGQVVRQRTPWLKAH